MFTPRQWEMLASGVEARMMDAGAIRRGAVRVGASHRTRQALQASP